ncbi:MAG: serpin family protein [Bacteroidales bacterium]
MKSICFSKLFGLAAVAVCTFLTLACNKEDIPDNEDNQRVDIVLTKSQQAVMDNGNTFAVNLFKALSEKQEDKNVFVSPLSASVCFAMLANGAQGETRSEILSALGYGNSTMQDVNEYYKLILPSLLSADKLTTISSANSLWISNVLPILDSYTSSIKDVFDAELYNVDFCSQSTLPNINSWCAAKTDNMIPSLLASLDPNSVLVLVNALYFKGIWANKFNKSDNADNYFICSDATKVKTTFMHQTSEFASMVTDEAALCTMPYGNGAYNMFVIMPTRGTKMTDFIDRLTVDRLNEYYASQTGHSVCLSFPKFKTEYDTEDMLIPVLKQMGMELPFTALADFSPITSTGDLSVSEARQKAVINVDEEGTTAAAATYIGMVNSAFGPTETIEISFDRPFIYIIRETSTGAILFMGVKNE